MGLDLRELSQLLPNNDSIIHETEIVETAVLVPLIIKDGQDWLLFQKRSQQVRQPGEICFPGGKVEPQDKDPRAAAIRETIEELGVGQEDVFVLGKLGVMIIRDFLIHVYVGSVSYQALQNSMFNQDEVEELLLYRLDRLSRLEPELYHVRLQAQAGYSDQQHGWIQSFPAKELGLPAKYHGEWTAGVREIVAYSIGEVKIWGITGRILKNFLEKIKPLL